MASIYPKNLIEELIGGDVSAYTSNEDCIAGLEYIISLLEERQRVALVGKYKQNKTYAVIGDALGVSRERASQLCRKAIRTLRKDENRRYVVFGMNGVKEADASKEVEEKAVFEEERLNFENLPYTKLKDFLSVRAYNALNRRAMLRVRYNDEPLTIGRLISMTDAELMEIRDLGKNSAKDVRNGIRKLRIYYHLDAEDTDDVTNRFSYDMSDLVKLCINHMIANGDCEFAQTISQKYERLQARM